MLKETLLKLAGHTSLRNMISICEAILDQKNYFEHTLLEQERVGTDCQDDDEGKSEKFEKCK